jgi:hypothetical protein
MTLLDSYLVQNHQRDLLRAAARSRRNDRPAPRRLRRRASTVTSR